jgi:kynureninase
MNHPTWLANFREKALALDAADPLAHVRQQFIYPEKSGVKAYFTGNSLGLQPQKAKTYLNEELDAWAEYAVEGHFHGARPWLSYHALFPQHLAPLAGAKPSEVVAMGQLTANLHLLLASFYQPQGKRHTIICEAHAFPSDLYALASHIRWHGLDEATSLIRLQPDPTTHVLSPETILQAIEEAGDTLALVMIGGVNYLSGQVMPMKDITDAAHAVGAKVGFDLAHAMGNVSLQLHDWQVDFAAWCSYKYLNSGPGSIAGIFVHERHHEAGLPRLEGWWGHKEATRFLMRPTMDATPTAEAWQLSNAPVLAMAAHLAALEIFTQVGPEARSHKQKLQTQFLLELLAASQNHGLPIHSITPQNARGCQTSLVLEKRPKEVFNQLMAQGIITDWREPNVIRVAPVPLYTQFHEIWQLFAALASAYA